MAIDNRDKCDDCGETLTDGDVVSCTNCIEKLNDEIDRLNQEIAGWSEKIDDRDNDIQELEDKVTELKRELASKDD